MKIYASYFFCIFCVFNSFSQTVNDFESKTKNRTGVYISANIDSRDKYIIGLKTLGTIGRVKGCVDGIIIGKEFSQPDINDMITVPFNASSSEMSKYIRGNCVNEFISNLHYLAQIKSGVFITFRINSRDNYIVGLKKLTKIGKVSGCVDGIIIGEEFKPLNVNDNVYVPFSASVKEIREFILSNCTQ